MSSTAADHLDLSFSVHQRTLGTWPLAPSAAVEIDRPVLSGDLEVRLANGGDVDRALALRHAVFCAEFGAATSSGARASLDEDDYDAICDHLVVIDRAAPGRPVVGTYRLLREEVAQRTGGFYSSGEYDLGPLLSQGLAGGRGLQLLELGRSCVAAPYRTHATIALLWRAIASYLEQHRVGFLFGCASFPGVDPGLHADALACLNRFHRAPTRLRVRAHDERYVEMAREDAKLDPVKRMPPLIKAYLRVGAMVGDGAVIDRDFNTIDVFMIMPVDNIVDRYRDKFQNRS